MTTAFICKDKPKHCPGFSVQVTYDGMETLTAQVNGGQAPYTYTWTGGGSASGPIYIIPGPGTYNVTVLDLGKCEAKFTYTVK